MSTIRFDSLYYTPITENASGEERYGAPVILAKAIKCNLSIDLAEAVLYADDAAAEVVKAFKEGDTGVSPATLNSWFTAVYEPVYSAQTGGNS